MGIAVGRAAAAKDGDTDMSMRVSMFIGNDVGARLPTQGSALESKSGNYHVHVNLSF